MNRFTSIVTALRATRIKLVEDNRAKKARKKSGARKRAPRRMTFASPELAEIFSKMPEECQRLIRNGGG